MALFAFNIQVRLQLSEQDKARFERMATALEVLVAKFDEAGGGVDQQPDVDALTEKIRASNAALADEVAAILAANP